MKASGGLADAYATHPSSRVCADFVSKARVLCTDVWDLFAETRNVIFDRGPLVSSRQQHANVRRVGNQSGCRRPRAHGNGADETEPSARRLPVPSGLAPYQAPSTSIAFQATEQAGQLVAFDMSWHFWWRTSAFCRKRWRNRGVTDPFSQSITNSAQSAAASMGAATA